MEKLIVPVYLNQRLVFDLLAMLRGGISTVTTVTRSESTEGKSSDQISTSLGLSNALSSLLKIDLSGTRASAEAKANGSVQSEERVHTPASLFYELRKSLHEKQYIRSLSDDNGPVPGDIVEFEAALRRNPAVETMSALSSMMEMAILFQDESAMGRKGDGKGKGSENTKIKKQMDGFLEGLVAGDTVDVTAAGFAGKWEALITLERQYLNDPAMADIVDGRFHVLGKVTRTVAPSDQPINLLRKSALSRMPSHIIQDVMGKFSELNVQGFLLPALRTEICGPAFQVIPIAVYA